MNNMDCGFKIETKPGRSDKIHIYANGEYTATVDATYWFSAGVSEGDVLGEDELSCLLYGIEERRAYNKALDLLSIRDHSSKELFVKLKKRFSDETSENAVEKARKAGFIDDEAFAQKLSAELFRRKKYGPIRIKNDLISKGISRESAQNAVEGLDIDDRECIIELLSSKFSGSLSNEKDIRRTFNSLMRMGYCASDIRSVMRSFKQDVKDF